MYDIQNALRRRAMAERLEALHRADEATSRASELPDTPIGPRHRAQPAASGRTVPEYAQRFVGDDTPLAREAALATHEPAERSVDDHTETRIDLTDQAPRRETGSITLPPPQPSAPVTPPNPFPSMPTTSVPPPSPYSPVPLPGAPGGPVTTSSPYVMPPTAASTAPSIVADERLTVPAAAGGGTALDERPRAEGTFGVRTPDQTARLDVTTFRNDATAPPPVRGESEPPVAAMAVPSGAVPSGVTLLRSPLSLPTDEPPVLAAAAAFADTPAAFADTAAAFADTPAAFADTAAASVVTAPAPAAPAAAAPAPDDVLPASDTSTVSATEPAPDEQTDDAGPGGSSAATIADLLRHGGSRRLFFDR
jgi:hypothetical protein